ncbi:two-component system, sensor histidine kinase YesM [Gracilibacillus orientalis]|uniref:Two-component system, sensor histidine kinase YesM n=1 Tax=Gracilibacillus orientalis TaxID=334253 RepID=A0A1I4IZI7_9BACI|nr:histidine kinase [Gracilibacillus orientalis]SFL59690.1 two-component system, sensor histidine kinase YesM [Gracilibacillus orientalis]
MKKLKRMLIEKLQIRKLRERFLLVLIILSIPPIFLVGIIAYNISANSIKENYTNYYHEQLKTFNDRIDYVFNSIIKMNRYILSNSELQNQLTSIGLDENEQVAAFQLQTIISNYIVEREYIDSVCLVDNQYRAICNGKSDNLGVYEGDDKALVVQQSEWFERAVSARGREVFFTYNVLNPNDDHSISTVKWLLDPRDMEFEEMGFLIININKSLFQQNKAVENEQDFMVTNEIDDEKDIVYSSDDKMEQIFRENDDMSDVTKVIEEDGFIQSQFQNKTTGWNFVHIIPEDALLKELHSIRNITLVIASIISVIAIMLSIMLSKTITNPLEKLKVMMIRWSKGEFGFTEKFKNDEVGQIGETFKKMAIDNKELMENVKQHEVKEREAELRVLQAHINPHFLYNTLDSIYWMAVMNQQSEIEKMSVALSESFKITLSKGKTEIPILEEIKHIDHYMTIQNIRYNNRFEYITEIDPNINEILILKLMLQPIVENSIYHGLEKKIGPGKIIIKGRQYNEMIEFVIADNGVGMKDKKATNQGYGLNNIKERLELYYGRSSSFKMKSMIGKGTVVKISYNPNAKGVYINESDYNR